ncbi:MAG: V-type ATP synthase subunit A [Spirochaetota bacterium]|jgi:V/A-type H+-transporting ATPase subunit A|nr:V-type ATP synthase subunit A [Spirochaetota bacterium]
MTEGIITSINGPIVHAVGMADAAMMDLVHVGNLGLIGEIIRFEEGFATIQVYEDNTGMKPGERVVGSGMPMSVALGPGLIGSIYDGIQRPLSVLEAQSGSFLQRGEKVFPLNEERAWPITPCVTVGEEVKPGRLLFEVEETSLVRHRLLVPPGVHGKISSIVPAGAYKVHDQVYTIERADAAPYTGKLFEWWPARKGRPFLAKRAVDKPLLTGMRVIDTFFPISKGGVAAIPGGFGTGKTMTQHALAKWSDADIIVYIGCGERGNEMTDVLNEFPKLKDPKSGKPIMERTILIANTSNMPVAAREISIFTGIAMAEYYRDMGLDVAIMADSTSRWAEALRELSGRLEEMPAEEGFPAYLPSRLAEFYERAGAVSTQEGKKGSISIIGAVSPPGGDFSEPVTQHTRRFTRCFWALDRDLANARHYPAISWLDSYSEYVEEIEAWWENVDTAWRPQRDRVLELLQREDRLQQIVKLVGPDALPDSQRLILLTAEIIKNAFLQQSSFDANDLYSSPKRQVMMLHLLLQFHDAADRVIKKGVPISRVRDLPILDEVRRMKSTISEEHIADIDALRVRVVQALTALEDEFK